MSTGDNTQAEIEAARVVTLAGSLCFFIAFWALTSWAWALLVFGLVLVSLGRGMQSRRMVQQLMKNTFNPSHN